MYNFFHGNSTISLHTASFFFLDILEQEKYIESKVISIKIKKTPEKRTDKQRIKQTGN